MYREAYDQEQLLISAEVERCRKLIAHGAEKGSLVEAAIRAALERVIPGRIGITSGFVVDSRQRTSKQMDIILFDRLCTPKIFTSGEVSILPVECTLAAGEIKTSLNSSTMSDSFEKCQSYKGLERMAYLESESAGVIKCRREFNFYDTADIYWPSLFFVIAIESISIERLRLCFNANIEEFQMNRRTKIDTVCCLSGPIIFNGQSIDQQPLPGLSFTCRKEQRVQLYQASSPWAMFLYLLVPILAQYPGELVNLTEYPSERPF